MGHLTDDHALANRFRPRARFGVSLKAEWRVESAMMTSNAVLKEEGRDVAIEGWRLRRGNAESGY